MSRMSDRAMQRKYMRDRARQDREMRDGRNPYGSRGGYVDSRRRDREMYDMNQDGNYYNYDSYSNDRMRKDYSMGDSMDYQYDGHKVPFELYGNVDMRDYNRSRSTGRYMRDREMDGHYPYYPPMYMNDYNYDYASGEKLDEEDLKEWYEKLCEEVPEQYKHLYKKENIEQVAKQMNIEFNKFKPMELVVTTLMMATDYPKSIGYADINRNVAMAKEWLEDKDSNLKGPEKLSAYYDKVIKG